MVTGFRQFLLRLPPSPQPPSFIQWFVILRCRPRPILLITLTLTTQPLTPFIPPHPSSSIHRPSDPRLDAASAAFCSISPTLPCPGAARIEWPYPPVLAAGEALKRGHPCCLHLWRASGGHGRPGGPLRAALAPTSIVCLPPTPGQFWP